MQLPNPLGILRRWWSNSTAPPRIELDLLTLEDRILYSATPAPDPSLGVDGSGGDLQSAVSDANLLAALNDVLLNQAVLLDAPAQQSAAIAATDQVSYTDTNSPAESPQSLTSDLSLLNEPIAHVDPFQSAFVTETNDVAATPVRHELAFVDAGVADLSEIVQDLQSQSSPERMIEVVVLDSNRDGIEQITAALADHDRLDAVHFLTHGTDRAAQLGGTWLYAGNMDAYSGQIQSWSQVLAPDGDILFYACDFGQGESGQTLLSQIGEWTGADIAASINGSGHASFGADWNLEYHQGFIETNVAVSAELQETWNGLLSTFTVINTNDSGAGSLRQAILDANALAGLDTITFNISGTGIHTINVTAALTITDAVTINATTDDSFAANSNRPAIILDGNNLNTEGLHLTNTADGSTIRGFVIRDFGQNAIYIDAGSDNNTIAGNYLGSLTTTGTDAGDAEENLGFGIYIDGAYNTIGGTSTADRNVISGDGAGIAISGVDAHHNQLLGNFIGTDAAGTALIGTGNMGIVMASGAAYNQIGSGVVGAANVIGGNVGGGIVLWDINTSNNVIQGNFIGTDLSATVNLANTQEGIEIGYGAANNLIGGTSSGQGNTIANNGNVTWAGVAVEETSSGNAILGNQIYSNAGPGIHLGWASYAPEPNDVGDADTGANDLQNYPSLTSANSTGGNTTISGSLNSAANSTFRVEFFSSSTGDASGHGEGRTYLGFTTVTTNASGDASFSALLTGVSLTAGHQVTATATVDLGVGSYGSTSEFSANVSATTVSPGVTITPTSGLTTTEAGGGSHFYRGPRHGSLGGCHYPTRIE